MAGYTPPKPAEKRARRNKDPRATVVLAFEHGVQPELPDVVDWHPQTVVWWEMWGRSAMAELFTESDWVFLAETALYHHALWNGNLTVGPELRLRVQKFGMTPEDRARLRIVFADADDKDAKRGTGGHQPKGSAYGNLRAVPKPS